jgi:hypothetical protein
MPHASSHGSSSPLLRPPRLTAHVPTTDRGLFPIGLRYWYWHWHWLGDLERWPRVLCNLWCGRLLVEVELVEHDVRVGVPDNDAAVADPGF